MPDRAKITSLEALEEFRSTLIVYLERASRAVGEIEDEVASTRRWLDHDRRTHWAEQLRRRTAELDRRQQELFSARMSTIQTDTRVEQMALQKARHAQAEAEAKMAVIKRYSREYDNRVAPLAKEVDRVRGVLSNDMRAAVAFLTQAIKTLGEYAELKPTGAAPTAPAAPAETPPGEAAAASTTPGGDT